jgi:hypothetical protein
LKKKRKYFCFFKLFFLNEKWTKIIVHFLILQKSFQTFFLRFFTFFEKYKFISDVIKIRNNVFWKKMPQSIRKKCKKCDFFDFFGVFQFSKK